MRKKLDRRTGHSSVKSVVKKQVSRPPNCSGRLTCGVGVLRQFFTNLTAVLPLLPLTRAT